MQIETFEEYKAYYKQYNKLPFPQVSYSTKSLNEKQLLTKYKDYQKKIESGQAKIQQMKQEYIESAGVSEYTKKVTEAMKQSKLSDPDHIRWNKFFNGLSDSEKNVIKSNMWMCPRKDGDWVFDTAHIIERGVSSKLADDVRNMIEIPRAFHHYIDVYKNPLSIAHEPLSRTEHDKLWIDLIGQELWDWLQENK